MTSCAAGIFNAIVLRLIHSGDARATAITTAPFRFTACVTQIEKLLSLQANVRLLFTTINHEHEFITAKCYHIASKQLIVLSGYLAALNLCR
jgi:hypothetical protein